MPTTVGSDRRKYRRIRASVYWRPAGVSLFARRREAVDMSYGGVRVYSDEHHEPGSLVKMEFFLEGKPSPTYTAEVVWIEPLAKNEPAAYDVGLRFVDLGAEALEFLLGVLGPEA